MSATFGVEAIRHFGNARANGVSTAPDLTYTFNRSNGFDQELRNAGHSRSFYWAEQDVWENDLQDNDFGGNDQTWADSVDLMWIETHGNHESDGRARLLYDTPQDQWRTWSDTWQLGEDWNAEWLMAYACETAPLGTLTGLWNIFDRLHLFLGSWENMWDAWTTDECGSDVADNLVDGDTVSHAWIDGVSDWAYDNHPMVVGPATSQAWNGGNVIWALSPHNIDHLHGEGTVSADLPPSQQGCLLWTWAEG